MARLTRAFVWFGWTRDDWKWFWLQVISVAALVSSGVFDVTYWCQSLGIPMTPLVLRWIQALSALVLWISARSEASKLPGKRQEAV